MMEDYPEKNVEQDHRPAKSKRGLTISFVFLVFLIISAAFYGVYWHTERRAVENSKKTEIGVLEKQKLGLVSADGFTVGITEVVVDDRWSVVSGTRKVVRLTAFASSEKEKIKYCFFAYRMKNDGDTWTTVDALKKKNGRYTLAIRDFIPEANYECCFVAVTKSGKHTSQMIDLRVGK